MFIIHWGLPTNDTALQSATKSDYIEGTHFFMHSAIKFNANINTHPVDGAAACACACLYDVHRTRVSVSRARVQITSHTTDACVMLAVWRCSREECGCVHIAYYVYVLWRGKCICSCLCHGVLSCPRLRICRLRYDAPLGAWILYSSRGAWKAGQPEEINRSFLRSIVFMGYCL